MGALPRGWDRCESPREGDMIHHESVYREAPDRCPMADIIFRDLRPCPDPLSISYGYGGSDLEITDRDTHESIPFKMEGNYVYIGP
jgi:hypothetical protein